MKNRNENKGIAPNIQKVTNELANSNRLLFSKVYSLFPVYKPYAELARLDRPIGWWLLLLPGWWAIALAAGGLQGLGVWGWYLAFLFLIGAIVMRAAGCVVNDLWDREFDRQVERTKLRPLAAGTLTPAQALAFLGVLLFIGFAILIQLSTLTIVLGFLSLPLIAAYPLMKRYTYWPQAFLGLTFNFGALMGWSAVTGGLSLAAVLLYLSGILWTLVYDTVYAHQDKEDDALAGIKSTALLFGDNSKLWTLGFGLASWVLLLGAFAASGASLVSYVVLLAALALLKFQLYQWRPSSSDSSLRIFKAARIYGLVVLIAALFA
jgi:4-hydroxybenzoate polyprenyltransferase